MSPGRERREESRAVDAHRIFLETRSFGSLDGLRALSIMAVLWLHTVAHPPDLPVLHRGFLGVDLFFVISGFLIATLLLRERRRTGTLALGSFYVRRTLRIVPAYWLMLALALSVAYLKPGDQSANIKHDLPFAFFYVSNFVVMTSLLSITWSLSTEEQFYLVVPWLQKHAPRMFPRVILPLGFALAALPPFGILPQFHLPEFFRQTTFCPILLGVILAYVLDSPRSGPVAIKMLANWWSPLLALALLGLTVSSPRADISGWPRLSIQIAMVVLVAACVVRERHVFSAALTLWPIRRIGVVSYGIYLYHLLVVWPVSRILAVMGLRSEYVFFLLVAIATWGVAELSYRFFELKFLRLKQRYVAPAQVAAARTAV